MDEKKDKAVEEKEDRDRRLANIRTLITNQSEDAAKLLKMWLDKSAEKGK